MRHMTRRRFFSNAGDMALGLCTASSPLLAGCTQAAAVTTAPATKTVIIRAHGSRVRSLV